MWSRLWLNDEKIRNLKRDKKTDLIADLIDYFCFANECLAGGKFEAHGVAFGRESVEERLLIDPKNTEELIQLGFLNRAPFMIKNWEKYQNPDSKRDFIPDLKQSKNTDLRQKTEDRRRKTKDLKTKALNLPSETGNELTPHRKLCLLWTETMVSETGNKGPFTGRDAKNLSELLKVAEPQNVAQVIQWAIKTGRKNQYLSQKCDRLYKIYENWNLLFSKVAEQKEAPVSGSKYKSEAVKAI